MKNIILIISLIFILVSCKKEEDTNPPIIQITTPSTNSYFSVEDTIQVTAEISDNEIITSVSVYILNDQAQNISGIQSFTVNAQKFSLNATIILDDIRIESGSYNIVVSANDEFNNKKSYRDISLTSVNKKLEKILLVTSDQTNTYIFEEDLTKSFAQKYIYTGLLCDAEINSYYNSLLLLSKSGDLISLNTENYQEFWRNSNLNNPPYEYNGTLLIDDYLVYTSQKNNSIAAYSYDNFVKKTSISENTQNNSNLFCIKNDYIIGNSYSNGIGVNKIEKYYYTTGAYQTSINLNYEPIEFLPSYDNSILIFGNSAQDASISAFYLLYNTLQERYSFANENIIAACKISDKTFIVSTNQNTYMFDAESQNTYILQASYSPTNIFYEETNNLVYCTLNNEVKIFTLPYFQEYNNIITINNIEKVLFKYNK